MYKMILVRSFKFQAQTLDWSAMDEVLLYDLKHVAELHMTIKHTLRIYDHIWSHLADIKAASLLRTHIDIQSAVFYLFLKGLDQLHPMCLAATGTFAIHPLISAYKYVLVKFLIAFHLLILCGKCPEYKWDLVVGLKRRLFPPHVDVPSTRTHYYLNFKPKLLLCKNTFSIIIKQI